MMNIRMWCVLVLFTFLGINSWTGSSSVVLAASKSKEKASQISEATRKQAEQELKALQKDPKKFRTLVTGVQIFLGRFGYGIGPFSGTLDAKTKKALKAYQQQTGLSPTGEIDFPTLKHLTEDDRVLSRIVPFLPAFVLQDKGMGKLG